MRIIALTVRRGYQFARDPRASLLMLRMAGWVCMLSLAVKLRPLPQALALLSTSSRSFSNRPLTAQQLANTIDKILKVEWFCFEPICWKRAAVLHRYLAISGISTKIVFGVRKESGGTVRGHAWLEANGTPILEKTPPEYTITYRFPSNDQFRKELTPLN